MAQQIEGRIIQLGIWDTQRFFAEIFAKGPLVEHEPDIKGGFQRRFDLVDFSLAETMADQRGMVDRWRLSKATVANSISDDFFDLGRPVAEGFQGCRNRAVDDLEIATTGQLLELHQGKVRLDTGCVTIHDQTDCASRRDDRHLRIAVSVLFAQRQRLVPCLFGQFDQTLIRAVAVVQWQRLDR